ncbi:Serine palmitoyltransferase [Lachnellula suecica]|uniref:Serine palmitoyltransferase n=1 Tax=Lachnellula suecica TaxID=602035 RepID=A0A8T9C1C0_9HELO|nr:Serine palmitoyltransferase [Lachnellula suecica]
MAPSRLQLTIARIRRIFAVNAIATRNVYNCFNGIEQFMLAPPEITRLSHYNCYDELDEDTDSDSETAPDAPSSTKPPRLVQINNSSARISKLPPAVPQKNTLQAQAIAESQLSTSSNLNSGKDTEQYREEPIHSQFGPIGCQSHRYVSKHMGGPLPQLVVDEPPYFYLLTTYISYMILIFIGRVRDFLGKRFKPDKYKGFKERDGYAALNSDFDNFYFRRLKARINDCFSRPITGVPGRYITLMDRVSHDHNETFTLTGTLTTTLNLSSYNYLGFAQSSGPCADDTHASISTYGLSVASPRLEAGTTDLTQEVEREIAAFVGKEDAMVFSMGFSTNATSFPGLMGPGCLIMSDELNHASIRIGARLSGAVIRSYKHNDMGDLEKLLREAISQGQPRTHTAWKKILVVCEGLFSMEGNIADLPGLCRLKKKYKFYLFVDEAHSIGALGPRGRGICDYFGIAPSEVDILMGTLTKSFGANGGYVAGDKAIIQTLRSTNAAMIYGESPAPPVLMQILSSLRQITSTDVGLERLQRITFNSRYLRLGLKRLGFIVYGHDDSPVVPVMLYHPAKLPAFSREMLARGISIVLAGYPATPLLTARVRFCVSAAHNKEDMDRVLKACDEIGDLLDLKFSTGIMGGIEPLPEGKVLADFQDHAASSISGKLVAPRWKLEDVLASGVRDAKLQLG